MHYLTWTIPSAKLPRHAQSRVSSGPDGRALVISRSSWSSYSTVVAAVVLVVLVVVVAVVVMAVW